MTSADFHPDLRRIARVLPREPVRRRTLRPIRAATAVLDRRRAPDVEVLTLASGVRVRLHRPAQGTGAAPALLWVHGGGYVIGKPSQDDGVCRRFSRELGITVAAVQYRLAPEHPYPAALQDCYAALTWLTGLPTVDSTRVAIGGASAGGGLAAALALLARDRGEVSPVLQLLVYPMLDDRSAGLPADKRYRLWTPRSNRLGWTCYLGGYLNGADPQLAVPARRGDLSGLPPAWIGVGTLDLFHDEDLAYARRLSDAGVPCHLEVVPGAFHGFDAVAAGTAVSRSFFASQCASLNAAFTPET